MITIYTPESQELQKILLSMQLQIAIKYEHTETNVRYGVKPCMKMSHFELAELIQSFHKKHEMSLKISADFSFFCKTQIARNLLVKNS